MAVLWKYNQKLTGIYGEISRRAYRNKRHNLSPRNTLAAPPSNRTEASTPLFQEHQEEHAHRGNVDVPLQLVPIENVISDNRC